MVLSLAACSPRAKSLTPSTSSQPSRTSTRVSTPTRLPTLAFTATLAAPRLASADEIIDSASIHSIPINSLMGMDNPGVQLALDDRYIYLAGDEKLGSLYRLPLAGGNLERITRTRYVDGRLNLFQPIVTGDWIVFADTPATLQGVSDRWMVRAVNLKNFSERLVAESTAGQINPLTTTYFAGEAGKLYWTRAIYATDGKIDQATLSMMDLGDGKTTHLSQTSYSGWTWSLLHVSNGRLVLQQDLQENYHSNIFLFDPSNGQLQALSHDGISYWPLFGFPWVAWVVNPRDRGPTQFEKSQLQLYNLQTFQSRTVSLPGTSYSNASLDGSYVYWAGGTDQAGTPRYTDQSSFLNAFYLFALNSNVIYEYLAPEPNVVFQGLVLRGKTLAWIRNDISGPSKADLEWTTLK